MFIISIIYRTVINVSDFRLAEYSLLIMTTMQIGYILLKSQTQTKQKKPLLKMLWLKIAFHFKK